MEVLKKKLADVEGQLRDRTTTVSTLIEERDRLVQVETELNRTVQRQSTELADLKKDHAIELEQLAAVHTTTVETLQKERDEAVAKLETATTNHQQPLLLVQGQASDAMMVVIEMDDKIAGKFFLQNLSRLLVSNRPSFFGPTMTPWSLCRMLACNATGCRGGSCKGTGSPACHGRRHLGECPQEHDRVHPSHNCEVAPYKG